MRRLLLALGLAVAAGCTPPASDPGAVFDAYFDAFSRGDAERMWALSTPTARQDAMRLKRDLLAALENPDVAVRTQIEGTFGVTADDVRPLEDEAMFAWAVRQIIRQLGVPNVQRFVASLQRVRLEAVGPRVLLVYRENPSGRESILPLLQMEGAWRVDTSPFATGETTTTPVRPAEPPPDDPGPRPLTLPAGTQIGVPGTDAPVAPGDEGPPPAPPERDPLLPDSE